MVLNPDATSASEILPVPGAANKSNCPSGLETAFLGETFVFSFVELSTEFVFTAFSIAKVLVKFVNKFRNSNSCKIYNIKHKSN